MPPPVPQQLEIANPFPSNLEEKRSPEQLEEEAGGHVEAHGREMACAAGFAAGCKVGCNQLARRTEGTET